MVSRVLVSLIIAGFCCVSTQDVSSDLPGDFEVENVTEAIGTSETVQSSSAKPAFTKATSVRKEKGIKMSKVTKPVSLNQTSGVPFSELSSTLKVITSAPPDAINNFGPDRVNLNPGRFTETVSVTTETTSKDLVTSGKGVIGRYPTLGSGRILNTVKEKVTERMPDKLEKIYDDDEVSSEKLDFKLHTKELKKELLSLNGSDLITAVHAEYKNESSVAVKIVPEDREKEPFMDVTVDRVEKVILETTWQPVVEEIESKQDHLDFDHLPGLQKTTVPRDDEIELEDRPTETTKGKKTTTVHAVDESLESVEVVLEKPELDRHSSDIVLQKTIPSNETRNEPLFVEWVGVEQKQQPDLKLGLGSNMTGEVFKGRGQPKNGTAHFQQNIELESVEGRKAFGDKKSEADDSGSSEIHPKITPKDFKESLNGVTLDRMGKDPHGPVRRTLDMFYKTVEKARNESRGVGLNFLEADDTFGQITEFFSTDPVLTVDEFGSESMEEDAAKNASADVTDRLKSFGVEPKIHSSIGSEHLDWLHKDLGGPSPLSSARSPARPSTRPSRTSLGPNKADDILVIEARRGHKKTDVIGVTLIDRVIENRIPIGGRGPADFPEPTGDSALKVAKGGSEDSSNDDSGATGVHEGGKVEVVKAAAGHERYAEELSKWGSVSWAFASGFVTSLLATGLCYLVVRSRRTSTYRIREIAV